MADDSFLKNASLALLVQKILLRESSEEHPLSISDILEKLQQYNIFTDRRRVKEILELFYSYSQKYPESLFTVEKIEKSDLSNAGYNWYVVPPLDPELVEYIALGITPDSRLSSEQLKNLFGTVSLLGGYDALSLLSNITIEDDKHERLTNNQLYSNIKKLTSAIQEKLQVTFELGGYNTELKLTSTPSGLDYKRNKYKVYPVKIVARRGQYYLLARFADSGKLYHFSLEYMLNINIVYRDKKDGEKIQPAEQIPETYPLDYLYMYSDPLETFTIHVKNERSARNSFFNDFGHVKEIYNKTHETFDAKVEANEIAMTQWALHNYDIATVEGPLLFQLNLKKALKVLHEKYE